MAHQVSALDMPDTPPAPVVAPAPAAARSVSRPLGVLLGVLRLATGWVLLWAGLDKVFGWGLSTPSGAALIDGVSPTRGFLQFGLAEGSPAAAVLQPLAGNPIVDVLYLLGTVGAGLALVLGIGVRIAGIGGAVLFGLLWFSSLPLEHNPFLDEHLLWALACLVVVAGDAGRHLGLGTWWQSTALVTRARWLA